MAVFARITIDIDVLNGYECETNEQILSFIDKLVEVDIVTWLEETLNHKLPACFVAKVHD